jgi:hypothetical protein
MIIIIEKETKTPQEIYAAYCEESLYGNPTYRITKETERNIINSIDFYLSKGMYNYEIYNNLKKIFGIALITEIGKNRINEICNDMRAGFNSNISLIKEMI